MIRVAASIVAAAMIFGTALPVYAADVASKPAESKASVPTKNATPAKILQAKKKAVSHSARKAVKAKNSQMRSSDSSADILNRREYQRVSMSMPSTSAMSNNTMPVNANTGMTSNSGSNSPIPVPSKASQNLK